MEWTMRWGPVLLALACTQASGQTVYACTRDGVRVYQDTPCGGDQVVMELEAAEASAPPPGVQAEMDYVAARHPGRGRSRAGPAGDAREVRRRRAR